MESYKITVKTTKGRKRVEYKNKNKEQGQKKKKIEPNIIDIYLTIPIITFNVSGLNVFIKGQIFQSGLKNMIQLYMLFTKMPL